MSIKSFFICWLVIVAFSAGIIHLLIWAWLGIFAASLWCVFSVFIGGMFVMKWEEVW